MNCKNCGAELDPRAKFCPSCGMAVEASKSREETHTEVIPEPIVLEPMPAPEPLSAPEPVPLPTSETVPAPATETVVIPEPDSEADPESDDTPARELEPEPAPVPGPTPVPEPVPTPEPAPAAGPAPKPKVPWYATVPARIVIGLFGVFMLVTGIIRLVGAFNPAPPEAKVEKPIVDIDDTGKPPVDIDDTGKPPVDIDDTGKTAKESKTPIQDISIKDSSKTLTGSFTDLSRDSNGCMLRVTNDTSDPLTLETTYRFVNAAGGLRDKQTETNYIEPGETSLLHATNLKHTDNIEYEITPKAEPNHKPISQNIQVEQTKATADELTLKITNSGSDMVLVSHVRCLIKMPDGSVFGGDSFKTGTLKPNESLEATFTKDSMYDFQDFTTFEDAELTYSIDGYAYSK
jgi:hypothetical protein